MANLFWISAAKVYKEHGPGPHSAANLLAWYGWTFTRADVSTCATWFDNEGTVGTALAGSLRMQYDATLNEWGFVLEGTRTNVVLWNRDMTNAAWTKTTMTAALDQVGVDGVTNSASSLLATAGNATCLQAITLGSSARFQSAYVKRLVGSGAINMTLDNGATWTVITLTTAWTRVTVPTQTLANPTVGFRIVTNADKIAVDYVQNENGAFQSSAIPTTTVAVVRAADSLTLPFTFGPMDLTVLARIARPVWADSVGSIGIFPVIAAISTSAPALRLYADNTTRVFIADIDTTVTDVSVTGAIPAGATLTPCAQYRLLTTGGKTKLDPGTGFGSESGAATGFAAFGNQTLRAGDQTGGTPFYGVLLDLKGRQGLVTLATMLTEPAFSPVGPFEVTDLDVPGALISKAQSGRVNTRSTQQIGRTWTEHYLLQVRDTTHREFLARMRTYWGNGTTFAKGHVDYATMKGVGGGTPRVKGASQTGSTLIVDGCPLNTVGWLLAGDIIRVQGLPQALEVAADVNTEGDGRALITLTRPIFTGGSPSDNAGLTITGVTLDVCLLEPPSFPTTSGSGNDWGELVLNFSEAL